MKTLPFVGAAMALCLASASPQVAAADVLEFYKGRQVTVIVASDSAGLAGQYGGVVGENVVKRRHEGRRLLLQRGAEKRRVGHMQVSPSVPTAQLLESSGIRYDAAKLTRLGQSADQNGAFVVWHASRITTLEDAKKADVILGATGKSSETYIDPTLFNAVLGTKVKMVLGYRSSGDLKLAMEQDEIHGYSGPTLAFLSIIQN